MGQKRAWPRSHDLLFKLWDPLIRPISKTAEDTNLKFCTGIKGKGTKQKMQN